MMLPALRYGHQRSHYSRPPWITLHRPSIMDQNYINYGNDGSQPPITVCTSANSQIPYTMAIDPSDQSIGMASFGNPYAQDFLTPTCSGMAPGSATAMVSEHSMPTERELQRLRRQEQNRRSQKEFRKRKEERIKELQDKLKETEQKCQDLSEEAGELRSSRDNMETEIDRLMEENRRLRSSMESSPASELGWMPGAEQGGSSGPSNVGQHHDRSSRRSG